jgi:hypothetical protein
MCCLYKSGKKTLQKIRRLLKLQTTLILDLSLLEGKPQVKECYSGLHKYYPLTPFSYCFRIDKDKPEKDNSLFQLAASWQANKNFLLKVSKSIHLGHHD